MLVKFTKLFISGAGVRQIHGQSAVRTLSQVASNVARLDASKLIIEKTSLPTQKIPKDKLVFGTQFTDHMLQVEWSSKSGWAPPKICPRQNLSLDPLCVVFHYGFELFEGTKAYCDEHGNIRTFRIDKNMHRMNVTAERIAMPTFDISAMTKLIDSLLVLDRNLAPTGLGYSLYLRPTMIGTTANLGVRIPDKVLLYVIMSPVGPYFSKEARPISLEATDYAVRAWPGGTGNRKLGGNYAPCIKPQLEASKRGYDQNMWLFGDQGYITEVGMMNVFFVFKNPKSGKKELVTAPLDGTILEGVTRDSILELARARLNPDEWIVSERKFTISEVKEAAAKGNLIEAFGAGTAAIVAPINKIGWRRDDISVPVSQGNSGELASVMKKWIEDIQYGKDDFKSWSKIAR